MGESDLQIPFKHDSKDGMERVYPFVDREAAVKALLGHLGSRWSSRDYKEKGLHPILAIYASPGMGKSYLIDWICSARNFKKGEH